MKGLLSTLYELDMLGPAYKFEVNGSQEFKSLWGLAFSVIIYGFCASAAIILGMDIWERKKPLVSLSIVSKNLSVIPLSDLPIMISIYDKHGKNKLNFEEYVSHKIIEVIGPYTYSSPDTEYVESNTYFFHCNLAKQYSYYNQYTSFDYLTLGLYCPTFDSNSTLVNEQASENSITYSFYFYKCDISERKCADDLDEAFDSLDIYYSTVDSIIDAMNYTDPIKKYEYNKAISLSNTFQKTVSINLERAELASDEGWIFEDIIITQTTKVSEVDIQYSILSAESKEPKVIMKLSSLKNINRTTRNYLKVQEVFARIGGIANALWITFSIMLRALIRFEYYTYVRGLIDSMLEDYKEDPIVKARISRATLNQSENLPIKHNFAPVMANSVFNHTMPSNHNYQYPRVILKSKLKNETLKPIDLPLGQDVPLIEKFSFFKYWYLFSTCQKQRVKNFDDYLNLSKKVISLGTYITTTLSVIKNELQTQ